eukprot:3912304-Alexandrium_andersonii.AAC.1
MVASFQVLPESCGELWRALRSTQSSCRVPQCSAEHRRGGEAFRALGTAPQGSREFRRLPKSGESSEDLRRALEPPDQRAPESSTEPWRDLTRTKKQQRAPKSPRERPG